MSTSRVLLLDDDPTVLRTLAALVELAGHETRGTHGIDVLARLAEEGCAALIVIVSGVGGRVLDAARRFADENGLRISGVLAKPFTLLALAPLLDSEGEPVAVRRTEGADGQPHPGADAEPDAEDLTAALDEPDQLHVALQPKVTAVGQRLTGFEVLARWDHPVHGPVSPASFVPFAERTGLDRPALSLAVNLSAQVAGDQAFAGFLEERCRHHGVEPASIILELTETASTSDATEALRMLTRMRVRGFQLSLDDYGTGYSSMSQLARLPFTEIRSHHGRGGRRGHRRARPPGRAGVRPGARVPGHWVT